MKKTKARPILKTPSRTSLRRNDPRADGRRPPHIIAAKNPAVAPGFSQFGDLIMADYHSPTVVQQTIPIGDMTPLERLLLSHIFDAEEHDDGLYFHAETRPSDCLTLPLTELRAAFAASGGSSTATTHIAERLNGVGADDTSIEIDLSGMFLGLGQRPAQGQAWELMLQDIVRRSPTIDHVTIVSAFTCSKMRPDAFGGTATLITADTIKGKSTDDILEDLLAEESAANSAGLREHVLLRLDEALVKAEIAVVIEGDETLTSLSAGMITDADICNACLAVADHTDLSEEHGAAVFRAALAAIKEAERRRAGSP
jgi:hypothetical protein